VLAREVSGGISVWCVGVPIFLTKNKAKKPVETWTSERIFFFYRVESGVDEVDKALVVQ
jgi:hypothetical protein